MMSAQKHQTETRQLTADELDAAAGGKSTPILFLKCCQGKHLSDGDGDVDGRDFLVWQRGS
jgi:hypothetical protein